MERDRKNVLLGASSGAHERRGSMKDEIKLGKVRCSNATSALPSSSEFLVIASRKLCAMYMNSAENTYSQYSDLCDLYNVYLVAADQSS
ncbi:hypothetical protein TKK_0010349 [Trichogramma kaykai]